MKLKLFKTLIHLLLAFCLYLPSTAYGTQAEESRLKAVFVLNFAKLTEWPYGVNGDGGTFSIAILGKVSSATFVNVLNGQTIHGATVKVKFVDSVRQAKNSQLLYVSKSEHPRLTETLKEASHYPLLTVSDIPGFSEAGGMIGMVPVENRLGFDVNIAAVRKVGLSIGSQLLKLSRTIIK